MPLDGLQLGRYRLLRLIGSGNMGEVYLAEDPRIDQQVAIKVIRTEASPYPDTGAAKDATRLFLREARAIAKLDHPNILSLSDFGEENIHGMVFTYMVMPFRKEGSLATWLRQRNTSELLSPQEIAQLIQQAANALQHAHDYQIIHQDVKPSNFLIRSRRENPTYPDLLLTDFGIAKSNTATASVSYTIRGTPAYMAPEQWDGYPVPATDQYALAIMAYQLLTGRPPFQGTLEQVMRQHFSAQPAPPSTLNPQLSSTIDAVILHALAKKPEDRFVSISTFAHTFQQALQNGGDIRATLAISRAEALNGTTRTLTLPGGRQVSVSVPPGAYDGQIIRLDSYGETPNYGGSTGALILTIITKGTEEIAFAPEMGSSEKTTRSSNPNLVNPVTPAPGSNPMISGSNPNFVTPTAPATMPDFMNPMISGSNLTHTIAAGSNPNLMNPLVLPPPPPSMPEGRILASYAGNVTTTSSNRREVFSGRVILLIALLLLVVAGSLGLLFYTTNQAATNNANATAAAIAQNNANATATTQASIRATTTTVANATGTAQARVNATATFIAANPNPYPPNTGTLVLSDSLSTSSNWNTSAYDSSTFCQFTGGAYQASEGHAGYHYDCTAQNTDFSNFTFEVQMMITKGDCGAMIFRADAANSKYYFFRICQDGYFALYRYDDSSHAAKTLVSGSSSAINKRLNSSNVLAVVADGSSINLYVNHQKLGSASDNTYIHGQIGLVAEAPNAPTIVVYSNAKVWQL